MTDVGPLYEKVRAAPWPALASSVGHFALYESLLAGCADRLARGGLVDLSAVPKPDVETARVVAALRQTRDRTAEEAAFLEYFDLLEHLRSAMVGE